MYLKVIWIVCEPWCPLVCNTWRCQLCQVMSCCGAQFDWCSWMGPSSSWHRNNPGKLKRQFSVSGPKKPGTFCISKPAKIHILSWVNVHQQHADSLCAFRDGYRGHCPALSLMQNCVLPPAQCPTPSWADPEGGNDNLALRQQGCIQRSLPLSVVEVFFSIWQLIWEGIKLLYWSREYAPIGST